MPAVPKSHFLISGFCGGSLIFGCVLGIFDGGGAIAQILPDKTLPTPTRMLLENDIYRIDAGTSVGNNLFHSFEAFSLPTGSSAIFTVSPSVTSLFSRVTGPAASNIDGLIQVDGGLADFFFLNPNGVVFGPNASLDIGGSFLSTTAESINFSEGVFSTSQMDSTSLLTLKTPIGLQFGNNLGAIVNRSRSADTAGKTIGLQVNPNKTLALIGGSVEVPGGHIFSPQSHIELGSVAGGSVVEMIPVEGQGLSFNYDSVEGYQDIRISQLAGIDSSGVGGGFIQLQGRKVSVTDGSQVLSNTELDEDGRGISVNASEVLEVLGAGPVDGPIDAILFDATEVKTPQRSSISANITRSATGKGGDIEIQTKWITVRDGGDVSARVLGSGIGGNITINASESVEVAGNTQFLGVSERLRMQAEAFGIPVELIGGAFSASFIVATSDASGPSGNITIDTKNLLVRDGGNVAANPLNEGAGGDVTLTATESVQLTGVSSDQTYSPGITIGPIPLATGTPGTLTVTSPRLRITGGSGVGLSTSSPVGALGIFDISEKVEIIGTSPNGRLPSSISAQSAFTIEGKGGSVELATKEILISDGGTITATGANASEGGDISLVADFVIVDNLSSITTSIGGEEKVGIGGNVNLKVEKILLLRRNSEISARSGNDGRGGNIEIEADFIVALPNENSDIVADAVRGQGGEIDLVTSGLLGFEVRDLPTPERNDISASSELGLDGTVTIDAPNTDLNPGEIELDDQIKVPRLSQGCLAALSEQSSFVQTGRGGLPTNPASPVSVDGLWQDLEPLSSISLQQQQVVLSPMNSLESGSLPIKSAPKEAIEWKLESNGEIRLIAPTENRLFELSTASACSSK